MDATDIHGKGGPPYDTGIRKESGIDMALATWGEQELK